MPRARRSTLAIEERSRRLADINRPLATSINITTDQRKRPENDQQVDSHTSEQKTRRLFTLQTTTDHHHQRATARPPTSLPHDNLPSFTQPSERVPTRPTYRPTN
ncbi:hypothetical protein GN244_ATG12669 [Phytophthora infestans]|uniref:Uncharacterized protein n=1 Tax=Phytophthora infestans TaxID=4787 RepID=A0A833WA89_PHYIN|nr:hypothetical protein GN244_ATG12669 [Phytophthora infestans]